jgi:hypothetical protein
MSVKAGIKFNLKKHYDITSQTEMFASRVDKELLDKFRAFLKSNKLKLYTEMNKALILYMRYVESLTKHGFNEFKQKQKEWKPLV